MSPIKFDDDVDALVSVVRGLITTPTQEMQDMMTDTKLCVIMASRMVGKMLYGDNELVFISSKKIKEAGLQSAFNTAGAIVHSGGNLIYFSDDFFRNKLTTKYERAFVLYHEVLHIFTRTVERKLQMFTSEKDMKKFAAAADFYINSVASGWYRDAQGKQQTNPKFAKFLHFPKCGGLRDEKFIGLSDYEIFEKLPDSDMPNFDDHFDVAANPKQSLKNLQFAISAAIEATQSKTAGDNELDIIDSIYAMTKPVVRWQDKLTDKLSSLIKSNPTYTKVNRRSKDVIFPSKTGECVNLVIGIDSSGSMDDDTDKVRCLSETMSILNTFDAWKVWIVTCDTKPHLMGLYDSVETGAPKSIKFVGGGGTQMAPLIRYAKDLAAAGEEITACIVMTDGYLSGGDIESESHNLPFQTTVMVTETGNTGLTLTCSNIDVIHCKN